MGFLREIFVYYKVYLFFIAPIIFIPLVILYEDDGNPDTKDYTQEARCGYVVCIMATYWVFDVLPLAITSFLPMVLFPLLEVVKAKDVATSYLTNTNMVFLGGLILAVSIEHSGLHKRIALSILVCLGPHPMALLAGFMLPTWFLTMWISNTACVAMMIPVVGAVLSQMKVGLMRQYGLQIEDETDILDEDEIEVTIVEGADNLGQNGAMSVPLETTTAPNSDVNGDLGNEIVDSSQPQMKRKKSVFTPDEERKMAEFYKSKMYARYKSFNQALTLATAYAANVGGNGTLTGTPPNLVCKEEVDRIWAEYAPDVESPISFGSWMVWSVPESFINLIICYLWLIVVFLWREVFHSCNCKCGCLEDDYSLQQNRDGVKKIIRDEYNKLGPIRFNEIGNIFFFCLLVGLWLSRAPGAGATGWGSYFASGFVSDAVPAIGVGILLHIFPAEIPKFFCNRKKGEKPRSVPALLSWNIVSQRLAWGPIILLGGGFAMASACQSSGLSELIAKQLDVLVVLPNWVIVLGITSLIAAATEITSNTATTQLLLPIVGQFALNNKINPLYLMMPATLGASYAFMLPVATPPNAIVYAYGNLRVWDMVRTGFFMNICCILVNLLATHTWGMVYFDLGTYPFPDGQADANFTTCNTTCTDTCSSETAVCRSVQVPLPLRNYSSIPVCNFTWPDIYT